MPGAAPTRVPPPSPRRILLVKLSIVLLLLGCSLPVTARAQGSSAVAPEASAQAEARERELAAIRDQIMGLKVRLAEKNREAEGLSGELDKLNLELELQRHRIAEAKAARSLVEDNLAETGKRIAALNDQLATAHKALAASLVGLYRLGRGGYVRLFLTVRSREDLLSAVRWLRYLIWRDSQALERYRTLQAQVDAEHQEQLAEQQKAEAWLGREETRRRQLANLQRRQARLLAETEREKERLASRAQELSEKAQKLSHLLDFLYGRSKKPLAGTPIERFRGVLDWPAAGKLTVPFGPRIDPTYRTEVPHNGVDLETTVGEPVKAIYPGRVLFAAPFQGYGPTVVLLHPGGALSLYAGLRALEVKQGDVVSLGQPLGTASGTLYFEIRVANRPEDPTTWLR